MPPREPPEPPQPPDPPRHLKLHRYQWFGVPLLLLLPALAAFGIFGESRARTAVNGVAIEATVEAPVRYRLKQVSELSVLVRNRSAARIDTIRIAIDTAFATRFSVRAIPEMSRAYEVAVADVQPDETRLVVFELKAERYGRSRGSLAIQATETLRVPLTVTVYP